MTQSKDNVTWMSGVICRQNDRYFIHSWKVVSAPIHRRSKPETDSGIFSWATCLQNLVSMTIKGSIAMRGMEKSLKCLHHRRTELHIHLHSHCQGFSGFINIELGILRLLTNGWL